MTTSTPSSGTSTGSEAWAALGGLALGLALSGVLRWGPRHRKARAILVPLGLNLAALAFLAAILAAGREAGALPQTWLRWIFPVAASTGVGLLVFRFPRAAGLPLLFLGGAAAWLTLAAVKDFRILDPMVPALTVQPLTDQELTTAFLRRADFLSVPDGPWPSVTLYRLRPGTSSPTEWWWTWAAAMGLADTKTVDAPSKPLKFGLFRLSLAGEVPHWRLAKPELAPP